MSIAVNRTNKLYTLNGKSVFMSSPSNNITYHQYGNKLWSDNISIDDGLSGIYSFSLYGMTNYYYSLAAAKRIASNLNGWRVPTLEDWNDLFTYPRDNMMDYKTSSNWSNYTDNHGISRDGNGYGFNGFDVYPISQARYTYTPTSSTYYFYKTYSGTLCNYLIDCPLSGYSTSSQWTVESGCSSMLVKFQNNNEDANIYGKIRVGIDTSWTKYRDDVTANLPPDINATTTANAYLYALRLCKDI